MSDLGSGTASTSYLHLIPPAPDSTPALSTFSDASKSPPIKGNVVLEILYLISERYLIIINS